jgi:hypothetical protein
MNREIKDNYVKRDLDYLRDTLEDLYLLLKEENLLQSNNQDLLENITGSVKNIVSKINLYHKNAYKFIDLDD